MRFAPPLVAALLGASPALAAEPSPQEHRLVWKDEWPRFRISEYGATATLLAELALIQFRAPAPREASWTGALPLDDQVRDAMRLRSREGRETVSELSDPIPLVLQAHALFDGMVVPLLTDRWNTDLAWQMTMMNLEAMGAAGVFNRIGQRYVARERPSVPECRKDPKYFSYCKSTPYASFPGGHTSGAFLGAGMACAHHLNLPLYGGGTADVIACAVPLAAATATGAMRIMGDRHYFSDIVVGAAGGFLAGYGLPALLHYDYAIGRTRVRVLPATGDEQLGLIVAGAL